MSDQLAQYYQNGKENLDYIVLDTIVAHRKLRIGDLTWSEYTTNLDFKTIQENEGTYTVEVEKDTTMNYRCMNGEQSEEWDLHKPQITKNANGDYQVVTDEYENEVRDSLLESAKEASGRPTSTTYKKEEKVLLADSLQEVKVPKAEQAELKSADVSEEQVATTEAGKNTLLAAKSASFTFHTYNRTAAKNYAYRYVKNPNPAYARFETEDTGNCTNFTSQCLKAGGIVEDKTGNYQWYYKNVNDRAPAWTGANFFRTYYLNNKGGKSVKGLKANKCSFDDLRLGDLIQNVTKNGGRAKHTMFASSAICDNWVKKDYWKYKYDVGICQNSTKKVGRLKNVPLSTLSPNEGCIREYVHISGSYY